MKNINFEEKPIIGMIHLKALPGTSGYDGRMESVYEKAFADAQILVKAGIQALMIENDGDQPYESNLKVSQVAALAAVASRLGAAFDLPFGISAAFNDYKAGLAIAAATQASFVRIPVFVDTVVSFNGIIAPVAAQALKYRRSIGAEHVKILADVQVKYTKMLLSQTTIEESAKSAESCGADAVIVTGTASGCEPPIEIVRRVKKVIAVPVLIGSGSTSENIDSQLQTADGAIVGTAFKTDGQVDEMKVYNFMNAYKGGR